MSGRDIPVDAAQMYQLCVDLFPITRSITGAGARETLARVSAELELDIHEVPSGTPAFDWIVPAEWNVRDAFIEDARGDRVVDLARSNLHLVSYSTPVRERLSLE